MIIASPKSTQFFYCFAIANLLPETKALNCVGVGLGVICEGLRFSVSGSFIFLKGGEKYVLV